ncbi:MAG: translation initiation factor [Bacteroidales bacterium]
MSKDNDWKSRLSIVYSTNPDFNYNPDSENTTELLPKEKQQLRIKLDKRNRAGKSVTLITCFTGNADELAELARILKMRLGVGGSSKDGEIIIQGDFRTRALEILQKEGYVKSRII